MIELQLHDGEWLDIPDNSIVLFEEITEGYNPNFPEAKSFIMNVMGVQLEKNFLLTKYEDVLFEAGATSDPRWLRLTTEDGRRIGVLGASIISRQSKGEGCIITVSVGDKPQYYSVTQSRREIKKWMERAVNPVQFDNLGVES
jgi:hypothetical protein